MLMKKDESGDGRLPLGGPEVGLSDDLGEARITRARAIKLAGATLAGSALSLLWAGEADARRKKKRRRRRRRRRKAQVAPPTILPLPLVPGLFQGLSITNPGGKPLTISGIRILESDGSLVVAKDLTDSVTIAGGDTELVPLDLVATDLVNADRLRLIDGRGMPITIVDEEGVVVNDGYIDVDVL